MAKAKVTAKLTVHAFSIVMDEDAIPLDRLFSTIQTQTYYERLKQISTGEYRVEHIEERASRVWYIDFGKLRDGHGPGAAHRKKQSRGLNLNKDEVFYEQTAAIFDLNTMHVILQFNFNGPRIGSIQNYLSECDENNMFSFYTSPKYEDDKIDDFAQRKATKSFTFRIDKREFTAADKKRGKSLWGAVDMVEEVGGNLVDIKISAGRSKSKFLNGAADKMLSFLRGKAEENPHAVTKLESSYVSEYDKQLEVIDLLAHRLQHRFEKVAIGADNRIELEIRYHYLELAKTKWDKYF